MAIHKKALYIYRVQHSIKTENKKKIDSRKHGFVILDSRSALEIKISKSIWFKFTIISRRETYKIRHRLI